MSQEKTMFSQSPLWQLQRQYFEEAHVNAWRAGDVPHYITSNPHMAEAYAQLLLAFFRDRCKTSPSNEPIYIIELGTGSGRFSYHLIKSLSHIQQNISFGSPPFVYVMTDFVEDNLAFWDGHPRLQALFKQGILDYAIFDAEKDISLNLRKLNKIIGVKKAKQPLVVIANYFFDSIPQDLFYFNEGIAETALVRLEGYDPDSKKSAKKQLDRIELEYTYEKLAEAPYSDVLQKQLFSYYQNNLIDSHLLFPHIGLSCIDRLRELSQEGLLLITADKGGHRLEDWQNRPTPNVTKHGSFSLTTNYHALKEHCHLSNGKTLFPKHPASGITVGALFYLKEPARYKETMLSYRKHVNDFGPDEYFSIKKHTERQIPELSTRELFAYLRLSGYDSRLFYQFLPRFHELVEAFTEDDRFSVLQLVARIWDGYYPLVEDVDLAFEIGSLLLNLHFFNEGISFFNLSEKIYGKKEKVMYAKAACYAILGNNVLSIHLLNELLNKYPNYESAQELLNELTNTEIDIDKNL
jgi:hypothetical protein